MKLIFNLGNGTGYSVQQVIDAVQRVTQKTITVIDADRRNGDPAVLVADAGKISRTLGWQPEYAELEHMIRHAWQLETQNHSH